eukprot:m.4346 g.4346  ORF g.4346 m.4346 type:complete len:568 (-) comp2961_c0_seq2:510-2213(-)
MTHREIKLVKAIGVFNLPISEYHLILDTRSKDDYCKYHLETAWNCPLQMGSLDLQQSDIQTIFDMIDKVANENPPDNYNKILVVGESAPDVAIFLRGAKVPKDATEHVQRFLERLSTILLFDGLMVDLRSEYPMLFVEGEVPMPFESIRMFPQKIVENLYLGSAAHASNREGLQALGIDGVVNVTIHVANHFESSKRQMAWEHLQKAQEKELQRHGVDAAKLYSMAYKLDPSLESFDVQAVQSGADFHPLYLQCCVEDDSKQDLSEAFEASFDFIDELRKAGRPVFVHCQQGRSRSAAVIIHYLLRSRFCNSLDHAIELVKSCRSSVQPNEGFMKQLAVLEGQMNPRRGQETQPEKTITTAWGEHLQRNFEKQPLLQMHDKFKEVWSVDILSADECTALIAAAEHHGFGTTNYNPEYRGNLRLLAKDFSLSRLLWSRLIEMVPKTLSEGSDKWDAVGLNEMFRVAKYYPGHRFGGHVDASFARSEDERSMYTVNIYLNGGFQGGCTRFYFNRKHAGPENMAFAVHPQAGNACIFRQPPAEAYFHDGEQLKTGIKYLLRTDVMYKKRN